MTTSIQTFIEQFKTNLVILQYGGAIAIIVSGAIIGAVLAVTLKNTITLVFKTNKISDEECEQLSNIKLTLPAQLIFLNWFVFIALSLFDISSTVSDFILNTAKVLSYIGVILGGLRLADILQLFLVGKAKKTATKYDDLIAPLIGRTVKVGVAIIGVLSIAEILSLPLASLLTGLGIGGIAIAMAAKDTIANIFGSITVVSDRPFNIGDWVVIDNMEGTVEDLGFRSTKIRTFYNSLISVPNSILLTAPVDNLGRRQYRRYKTVLSVQYDTPPEKIEAFTAGVKTLLDNHPSSRKDFYLVHLNEFSASSLDILLYCFFKVPTWNDELKARENLMLDILKLAKELSIEFAFPTQTVHLQKDIKPLL